MTAADAPAITAARVFHALSDPTRLELLELLRDGERCVCELAEVLAAAQSRLSFHLKVLKEAGLVADRRDGRWVHYRLRPEIVADATAALEALRIPTAKRRSAWWSCCQPQGLIPLTRQDGKR